MSPGVDTCHPRPQGDEGGVQSLDPYDEEWICRHGSRQCDQYNLTQTWDKKGIKTVHVCVSTKDTKYMILVATVSASGKSLHPMLILGQVRWTNCIQRIPDLSKGVNLCLPA
jgi:hypothetical protein